MKIMIINPNSDSEMTKRIQTSAKHFVNDRCDVICKCVKSAPRFIETYEDKMNSAYGMVELVKSNEDEYDAFIIACHCDPNLDLIKEITSKVVVGIGEASMKIASMIGHKFSVISTDKHSIPNKEALIRKYHLENVNASVRAIEQNIEEYDIKKKLYETSKMAIEEDMAEVIVLGCAGYTGIDKELEEELKIPVLDGVICALIIAEGLVNYNVSISKLRRYNPHY